MPTSSPRCGGGHFESGPGSTTGAGGPDDGYFFKWVWTWLVACPTPGDAFSGHLSTVGTGSTGRSYLLTLDEGPGAGKTYSFKDAYDAVSVFDQILAVNNYDLSYSETYAYREDMKAWIINYWIDADTFYSYNGF